MKKMSCFQKRFPLCSILMKYLFFLISFFSLKAQSFDIFCDQRLNEQKCFDIKNTVSEVWKNFPADMRKKINFDELAIVIDLEMSEKSPHRGQAGRLEEMAFIKISEPSLYSPYLKNLIAHEFVHLVHFAVSPQAPLWLQEGLASFLAEEVLKTRGIGPRKIFWAEWKQEIFLNPWKQKGYQEGDMAQYKLGLYYMEYLVASCWFKDKEKNVWKLFQHNTNKHPSCDSKFSSRDFFYHLYVDEIVKDPASGSLISLPFFELVQEEGREKKDFFNLKVSKEKNFLGLLKKEGQEVEGDFSVFILALRDPKLSDLLKDKAFEKRLSFSYIGDDISGRRFLQKEVKRSALKAIVETGSEDDFIILFLAPERVFP
jgi:hypothetical protein